MYNDKKVLQPVDAKIDKYMKFVVFIWKALVKDRRCSHQIPTSLAIMKLLLLRTS